MLKKWNNPEALSGAEIRIGDADFSNPFETGLEFNAPARGTWNIVHTGMLIPESHQIFACARGCLRGVILTAAEMNAANRMSWIGLEEEDLFNGRLESSIVEGTLHILEGLNPKPKAVLLFLSCIQLFAGIDFPEILRQLRKAVPDVDFIDCYMHPTMRKSGLTPDQTMRKQLYDPLKPGPADSHAVAILGNDRPTEHSSDLCRMLRKAGMELRDITLCKNYEEYLQIGRSALMIATYPAALAGAEILARRFGRPLLYLPLSYSAQEIRQNMQTLAKALHCPLPELPEREALTALQSALSVIGKTAIQIDYTATPRPLGLARLLAETGFHVAKVYADAFSAEEKADFDWLKTNHPELILSATVHPKLRFAGKGVRTEEPVLAIGQKAAYFSGTEHFVNMVAGNGMYGFDGIRHLAEEMIEAFRTAKNTERIIQFKGLGCESCLK